MGRHAPALACCVAHPSGVAQRCLEGHRRDAGVGRASAAGHQAGVGLEGAEALEVLWAERHGVAGQGLGGGGTQPEGHPGAGVPQHGCEYVCWQLRQVLVAMVRPSP